MSPKKRPHKTVAVVEVSILSEILAPTFMFNAVLNYHCPITNHRLLITDYRLPITDY
jgi:hypothetical protein